MKKYIGLILLVICLFSGGKAMSQVVTMFEYPVAPDTCSTMESRCNYSVQHFWDNCELNKPFAAENDCTFVEIGEHFKDARGLLPYEHCRDGFAHLRIDDAAIWAELLKDPANYSISPRA